MNSCGFQQRKYTHGYLLNHAERSTDFGSNVNARSNDFLVAQSNESMDVEIPLIEVEHDKSYKAIGNDENLESSIKVIPVDTIVPKESSGAEEDYVTPPSKDTTGFNPCFDPYRAELTKEVTKNINSGFISWIGTVLYLVGFILGPIFYFKSRKTQNKLKELNHSGQYDDLIKLNRIALWTNGLLAILGAFTLLIFILAVILTTI